MTLFELVKLALDDLYEQATAEYGDKVDAEIADRINYLSASYSKLTAQNREPIDYKSPATRFAYVYKYVATHGDYVVQAMMHLAKANGGAIFPEGAARISCIGGGPGSEIVAALKYLSENKHKEKVASDAFNKYFGDVCDKAGLKLVMKFDNVELTPRHSEQADVVKDYRAKFKQFPRLKGTVTFRAYRKPG